MIFLDANIFVDVLTARKGYEASIRVMEGIKSGKASGCLSALTVPLLWYLMRETPASVKEIRTIVKDFKIIPLSSQILDSSFNTKMDDFEDAIQLNSAIKGGSEFLITRNKKDFIDNKIPILTPEEFLARVSW